MCRRRRPMHGLRCRPCCVCRACGGPCGDRRLRVVSYATARRTREIAVRLALGADKRRVVVLVVREGFGWTAAGIGAGVLGALALSRYLSSLLFHVGERDPMTYLNVATLLVVIAVVATAIAAVRAVRVDPMLALRSE
jgi:putative ABC transport system permease protein